MIDSKEDIVFDAVKSYIAEHCYAPTTREICELTEIHSVSTVSMVLQLLIAEGRLESDHDKGARALRIPGSRVVFN